MFGDQLKVALELAREIRDLLRRIAMLLEEQQR